MCTVSAVNVLCENKSECLENIVFVGTRVTAYCVHPGISRTELGRHLWSGLPLWKRFIYKSLMFIKSPKEGAQTIIYCAVEESLQKESGLYYRLDVLGTDI